MPNDSSATTGVAGDHPRRWPAPPRDHLTIVDELANRALRLWDIPSNARAARINVSENITYLVEDGAGFSAILRVHRPGYHRYVAIDSELAWISALRAENAISTPPYYLGKNGMAVQRFQTENIPEPRFLVLFHFVDGCHPDIAHDPLPHFEMLGEIAAHAHQHSIHWRRPDPFYRHRWDLVTIFGPNAHWGDWRNGPHVTADIRNILERVEELVTTRLEMFGQNADRFGLIHADMRLANLIVTDHGTHLIDFDDCGFGWYLYDFAASVSFIEDHPQMDALKSAWVNGYRRIRSVSQSDEQTLDSFVMLRRLALLAWIGSHSEAPEPIALAPHFAAVSADLGETYLLRHG